MGSIVFNIKLLYLLVQDARQNGGVAVQRSATRSSPNQVFDDLVDKLSPKLQMQKDKEEVAAQRSTRNSLNYQNGTTRRQDLVPFDASKLDRQACPVCKHKEDRKVAASSQITPTNNSRKRDAPVESPATKQTTSRMGRLRKSLQEKMMQKSSEMRNSTDLAEQKKHKDKLKVMSSLKKKCVGGDAYTQQTVRDSLELGQSTQEILDMMIDEEEATADL